uniref:Uncharacterized protein n=1 Tax=Glossina palpalis gambiensis TaxID=67801 RepID=A0A1B0AQI4_9MUSC
MTEFYKILEFVANICECCIQCYENLSKAAAVYAHELNATQKQEEEMMFDWILNNFIDFTLKSSEEFLDFTMKIQEEIKRNNDFPDRELPNRRHEKFADDLANIKSSESEQTLLNMYRLTEDILSADREVSVKIVHSDEAENLIEKYKIREFMDKIRGRYMEFYEDVSNSIELYANELSKTQKQDQQKLFDWNEDFSEIKDFHSKTDKFMLFFEYFKPCCDEE